MGRPLFHTSASGEYNILGKECEGQLLNEEEEAHKDLPRGHCEHQCPVYHLTKNNTEMRFRKGPKMAGNNSFQRTAGVTGQI